MSEYHNDPLYGYDDRTDKERDLPACQEVRCKGDCVTTDRYTGIGYDCLRRKAAKLLEDEAIAEYRRTGKETERYQLIATGAEVLNRLTQAEFASVLEGSGMQGGYGFKAPEPINLEVAQVTVFKATRDAERRSKELLNSAELVLAKAQKAGG